MPGVAQFNGETIGDLLISWSEGNTFGLCGLSSVSVTIRCSHSDYRFVDNDMYTRWINPYVMVIRGAFTLSIKNKNYRFTIDTNFVIPESYRL